MATALRPPARGVADPGRNHSHRAVLALPDGTPFSLVVETYTNEVIELSEAAAAMSRRPARRHQLAVPVP